MKVRDLLSMTPGKQVEGLFNLCFKDLRQKSDGGYYLSLALSDETGTIPAKVWNDVENYQGLQKGDVVRVKAKVDSYQNTTQLVVDEMETASEEETASLRPRSPRSLEEMKRDWQTLVELVEDPHLGALLTAVWDDEELREAYCSVPGGTKIHHPYQGGLLEHSIAVAKGAYLLWRKVYPTLHRDLLIAGGLLHDIGKTSELYWKGNEPEYSDEGRLLGHVVLGSEILARKISGIPGFPPELAMKMLHIVASHHGEPEVGAAAKPQFKEAVVIHFMDEMDSKLSGFQVFIEKDQQEGNWTAYHRWFGRYIYKG